LPTVKASRSIGAPGLGSSSVMPPPGSSCPPVIGGDGRQKRRQHGGEHDDGEAAHGLRGRGSILHTAV
jgi:hypothetical protein